MRITATALPDQAAGLSDLIGIVADAERAGFRRAWLPQMPALPGLAPWDALMTLALAGQQAPTIELGTAVTIAYHQHPLTLARQALTTNTAVAGRLTLGIGVGHPAMIEALGHRFERPVHYLREYLEILIPAMAGQAVDFHGTHLTAVGRLDMAAPAPAVMIAALGPRMLDLAGALTDGTLTTWTGPKTLEHEVVPRITRAAAGAGRAAPQVVASLPVVVTSQEEAVRDTLSSTFAYAAETPSYSAVLATEGAAGVGQVSVVGDEKQVLAQLRRFAEIGVTEFVGLPFGDADTIARTTALLAAA